MNCWHCNTELIWGSDFDGEDYGCEEEYSIVTNLTCPKCESFVQVYYPNKEINYGFFKRHRKGNRG